MFHDSIIVVLGREVLGLWISVHHILSCGLDEECGTPRLGECKVKCVGSEGGRLSPWSALWVSFIEHEYNSSFLTGLLCYINLFL